MSNNRFRLDGFAELRTALRSLPKELVVEAQRIIEANANGAAATIKAAYPVRSGNLRDGVYVRRSEVSTFAGGAIVVNAAKHAHLYEFGTQVRRVDKTGQNGGAMPPNPTFIPVMQRKRQQMYEQLIELLERNGLTVTGSAG